VGIFDADQLMGAEIVGLRFQLESTEAITLEPYYMKGLHAWFLHQIEANEPELSLLDGNWGSLCWRSPKIYRSPMRRQKPTASGPKELSKPRQKNSKPQAIKQLPPARFFRT